MSTSTVIHFKASFKNKGVIEVPHCSRFALSPKYGQVTEDKALVNCSRCAKQLDIAPAAKKVSPTRGTCQCCFGTYETRTKSTAGFRSVLHGYTRPGCGYIIGDCRGCGFAPFQVSCEQTKVFRTELQSVLADRERHLADLLANKVGCLYAKVATGNRIPRLDGSYGTVAEYQSVAVKLGAEESPNPFPNGRTYNWVPSYETLQKQLAAKLQMEIAAIAKDIAFLTGKIDTWVAVAFPIVIR